VRPQQLDHKDARIHCAILNKRVTPPTTPRPPPTGPQTRQTTGWGFVTRERSPPEEPTTTGLFLQDPTGCRCQHHAPTQTQQNRRHPERWTPVARSEMRPHIREARCLLRKEVIQPHLPVRLPCYDFVPIASPTFDRSLR